MNDATRDKILREIVELVRTDAQLADDEVTTKDIAEALEVEMEEAYRLLRRKVRDGELVKRRVMVDGHIVCAYRKVDKEA